MVVGVGLGAVVVGEGWGGFVVWGPVLGCVVLGGAVLGGVVGSGDVEPGVADPDPPVDPPPEFCPDVFWPDDPVAVPVVSEPALVVLEL